MKRWLSNILLVVFAAIFVVSAYFLIDYIMEARKQQDIFNNLANLVEQDKPSATTPQEETENSQQTTRPSGNGITIKPTDGSINDELVPIKDPDTGETIMILPEYATVYMMNTDLVGWMKIDGTNINYPVMQTPDYKDYYLRRDFNGNYSTAGCLYAREECDVNKPSDNITIYGHKMSNGTMFAALHKYQKKSFWEENKYITFDTLTEHHTYEIMSVFITTASIGEGFDYHLFVDAYTEARFNDFVSTCKELALYDTGVEAQYGDKFITLSTCDYSVTNGRLVVVAKRVS